MADLQASLKEQTELAAKYRSVAEPDNSLFWEKGHISAHMDRAGIEALQLGVSCKKLPAILRWAARTFGVKVPTRTIKVQAARVDGKRVCAEREIDLLFGETHAKELRATMRQLNKLQAAEWMGDLLTDESKSCCYLADGAESMQHEWLGTILSKRGADGKLQLFAVDMAVLDSKTGEAQAERWRKSCAEIAALAEKAELLAVEQLEVLRRYKPSCSMNDRAANARKAARRVCGREDGDDDPTCGEHALVNVLEEGRKAIDAIVRRLMNITEEQAAADAEKVKALRTVVGWFSSPACSLIFMMQKYVALRSSKGYAIGAKAAEWLEAELAAMMADQELLASELLGHLQDVLAIRGSRHYVFYLDAAPTERLLQPRSIKTYLDEEAALADSNAGGKLRHAILKGANSEEAMAAVRAMAIICDAVVFPALAAIKPSADKHVLDVLPETWPRIHKYFGDAAADPAAVIEGSLQLYARLGQPAPSEPPTQATRGGRARLDMLRIREASRGNALVEEMVAAAMQAMVPAVENHAAEWLPGGKLCSANITPELRQRYDALVSTSSCVERIHAVGKSNDERCGSQRDDTRCGIVLARYNNQAAWLNSKDAGTLRRLMDVSRTEARRWLKVTMRQKRLEAGAAKRATRQERLATKRAKKEAAAAESRRIESLVVATKYSQLVSMGNTELSDQLKYHKHVRKQSGFTVTQSNRESYVRQLQMLISDQHGAAANDLKAGDDGFKASGVQRKKRAAGGGGGGGKRQKRADDESDDEPDDIYKVEAIVGFKVSCGQKEDGHRKGTKLYRVVWKDWPIETATWEPYANIVDDDLIAEYEASLEREAEEEAAAAAELEDDEDDEADAAEDAVTAGAEDAAAGDEGDEEAGEDLQLLQVAKVLRHHVYGGAKPGSLHNVYVAVQFSDGSRTQGGVEPSAPLAESISGRAALTAYVRTKGGSKIAKYVPFEL